MRGGLERWKRGVESHGVRQAIAYALKGTCDSHLRTTTGADAPAKYSAAGARGVTRFTVVNGAVAVDALDQSQLRRWVDGCDPASGERRGRDLTSPHADLLLDGTINAPKSFSIAALLNDDLATEFEALQDRLRHRIILTWQRELNARRGASGRIREDLSRIEVVELQHRRSRALDPHIHRHLWLNVKVQGRDGQWSNVDSRVAMKLHTVINAEGELAARTDPRWIAALARHGYTLNADGEVAQLAHAVRPMSRRSTQIEANRALILSLWREDNPGENPTVDQMHQIDRLAWARARPNKPGEIDEAEWESLVRAELEAIDPRLLRRLSPVEVQATATGRVNLDLIAAKAIVEADVRSTGTGGRFSLVDIRAGVLRAVAGSRVVADRDALDGMIADATRHALTHTIDVLDDVQRPDHVKGFMSIATAALKVDLATRFEGLTCAGVSVDLPTIARIAATTLAPDVALNAEQAAAAAAIGGSDRLVSITGPAGTGKTTMLRVAKVALTAQRRRMIVVAPTKKAASVAGREIGATASSLHALLADHGWRWETDEAGAQRWTRLDRGDGDPTRPGTIYPGPQRFPLRQGDRIVVDEAGMVDLQTANALAQVATDTGAGIAMIGDHLQATPVGHSGAMETLTRRASAFVELTAVHRFHDPQYAALTLRMRQPNSADDARDIARLLSDSGRILAVEDEMAAREAMVDAYFHHSSGHRRVALVTASNDEAEAINEAIQQRRVDSGELHAQRLAVGQGEQRLLEGDVVQTRRNDCRADVDNRALWTIRRITATHLKLDSVTDAGTSRTVDRAYASEHMHLAYASTVHGIQGETTHTSIVGPGVDAAGLYVGMTRGRHHNQVLVIAHPDEAVDRVAQTMLRVTPELTIDDARTAAFAELQRAAQPESDRASQYGDNASTRIGVIDSWITAAVAKIVSLDARVATREAVEHARLRREAEGDDARNRQRLVDQIAVSSRELDELRRFAAGTVGVPLPSSQQPARRLALGPRSGYTGRADPGLSR